MIVDTSSGLEKTIGDQLSSINYLIKEQEELLVNKLQDKDEQCRELAARLEEKTSELHTTTSNAQQVSRVADEKHQQVEELQVKIGELQEITQERHHLELDNQVLRERLGNQDTDNVSLQRQLEDALRQNEARTLELQAFTRQIADRIQEKGADASDVSTLRAKMACKLEMERSKLDESRRALQKHEEEKSKLEKDLTDMESEKSKFSKDLEELRIHRVEEKASLERTRMFLVHAEQRIVNLKDKLKKSEFKTRDIQTALAQWAGKNKGGAELPKDLPNLDLDAMRVLVTTMMDILRESEAAKECLRVVLEIPSSPKAEDVYRVEKPDCSSARNEDGAKTSPDGSTAATPTSKALEPQMGVSPIVESDEGGSAMQLNTPLDTSNDSMRRIIVQSPFEEEANLTPPSIEEEKMSRRQYSRPLSILKNAAAPVTENGSLTPTSPRGRRASANTSILKTRSRSSPPTYRNVPGSATDGISSSEVDARTESFLGRIKQSLGLQRTASTGNGHKRKGSAGDDGNPAKVPKTWQSMFGTLDLEMGDLKSSYFSAPAQPRRAADGMTNKGTSMLATSATASVSRMVSLPRGANPGQPGQKGKARGVIRTYSKKPQEGAAE